MIKVNENYSKLQASYLFADIAKKVEAFQEENPDKKIIKLGIGDVTKPLPDACVKAFHQGVDEMAEEATFRGYGPSGGYPFIREIISKEDFQKRGASISPDEIFISDGSKCDTANFQ
ncbi:MAG: LL-diaminopimelate aminotransferase, partial [Desulfobacteraceae bacterium]|nr:LL-diaminopimelate aminotransferase [Desulfobacteraceae bacterium]